MPPVIHMFNNNKKKSVEVSGEDLGYLGYQTYALHQNVP